MKKSHKDFGLAIEDLRARDGISYDTIAFGIRHTQSYVYGICNRRVKTLPKDAQIREFADFFHVHPEYFFEFRLKKLLSFIDENREFVDYALKQANTYSKKKDAVDDNMKEPAPTRNKSRDDITAELEEYDRIEAEKQKKTKAV